MLEMLEDPPRKNILPIKLNNKELSCYPYCINSTNHYCLSGYFPLQQKAFMLNKWNITSNNWIYNFENDLSYTQSILLKNGGQSAQDFKYSFKGNYNSASIQFYLKKIGNGFIQIDLASTKGNTEFNNNLTINILKLNDKNNRNKVDCLVKNDKYGWIVNPAFGCVIKIPDDIIKFNDKFILKISIIDNNQEISIRNIKLHCIFPFVIIFLRK